MWRQLLFFLSVLVASEPVLAAGVTLPDLGAGGISIIAGTREEHIGRSIVNELRRNNLLLEDPELTEYMQNLGARLVASSDTSTPFEFFIVRDDTINAFALPGGYIGIHSGLFLRTESESELASVIAHEVAHVTQRHIARRYESAGGDYLKSIAILLGAIALAASGADGDDVSGALMLGQGLAIQEQINFTRSQEYEADRVGIGILAGAGFDPGGMASFFGTMQRMQRLQNSRMPEFLSTHPLSQSRVVESAQRIQAMGDAGTVRESRSYPLMKARLGVLTRSAMLLSPPAGVDASESTAARYGRALQLLQNGDAATAVALSQELVREDDSVTHYHLVLGRALLEADKDKQAVAVLRDAATLFPGNIPVELALAESLRQSGQAQAALSILRDLFNRHAPEPEYIRIMAQTAIEAGAKAESHYYMAEHYLRLGDLGSARVQLQLAVDNADPASNDRLQYQARLTEVSDMLAEQRRNAPRQPQQQRER